MNGSLSSGGRCVAAATAPREGAETQPILASIVRTAQQRGLDRTDVLTTLLHAPKPIVSPHFYPVSGVSPLTR